MRGKMPVIQPVAPVEPRKISRKNLDNVFNTLLLYINLSTFNGSSSLAAAATMVYNRIQVDFNRDAETTLRNLKLSRKWFVEYARNNFLGNPGLEAWYWDSTRGGPIFLIPLLDLLSQPEFNVRTSRLFAIRVTIALLSLDRVMVIHSEPKYDTITSPSISIDSSDRLYPIDIRAISGYLGFTPEDFAARHSHEVDTFRYTVLSSAGVNGPATWTAHSDARAWLRDLDALNIIRGFATSIGLLDLFDDLVSTVPLPLDEKNTKDSNLQLGRVISFDEWGGKVRTVAIVDYWTQMLLTPLHNTINHFLKNVPMDGTFDQLKLADKVRIWTGDENTSVYSYDLTAATDRLPISLQVHILSALLGDSKIAEGWRSLLVDRDYLTDTGEFVRYATGQPMGARSSFPMLALTHHVIVNHAAILAGKSAFRDYVVLGDDMTVADSGVAEQYLAIMGFLGVPINLSKSIVHGDGIVSAGEICKRIFLNGDEITSLSPKLIAKTVSSGSLASTLQNDLSMRGIDLSVDQAIALFNSLVDKESFREWVILNVIPSDVSDVSKPLSIPGFKFSDLHSWFPGLTDFNKDVIVNVFTYTAAVEALKRLDGLLRQTLAISEIINSKYSLAHYGKYPVMIQTLWNMLGLPTSILEEERVKLFDSLKDLTPSHPMIKSAEAEIIRITEIISQLISADADMYNKARLGLLDMMRNSLVDAWADDTEARAAGNRTLLTKSLTNLKSMIAKGTIKSANIGAVPTYKNDKMILEYSVNLVQIQRQWTVRVGINTPVTINAVTSRITPNALSAKANAASAISNLSIF